MRILNEEENIQQIQNLINLEKPEERIKEYLEAYLEYMNRNKISLSHTGYPQYIYRQPENNPFQFWPALNYPTRWPIKINTINGEYKYMRGEVSPEDFKKNTHPLKDPIGKNVNEINELRFKAVDEKIKWLKEIIITKDKMKTANEIIAELDKKCSLSTFEIDRMYCNTLPNIQIDDKNLVRINLHNAGTFTNFLFLIERYIHSQYYQSFLDEVKESLTDQDQKAVKLLERRTRIGIIDKFEGHCEKIVEYRTEFIKIVIHELRLEDQKEDFNIENYFKNLFLPPNPSSVFAQGDPYLDEKTKITNDEHLHFKPRDGCRRMFVDGVEYNFGPTAQCIIKLLYENLIKGDPKTSKDTLMTECLAPDNIIEAFPHGTTSRQFNRKFINNRRGDYWIDYNKMKPT